MEFIDTKTLIDEYKMNSIIIGSFPRSGSHWFRRMLVEILASRNGWDKESVAFGNHMNHYCGFFPAPVNCEHSLNTEPPYFSASHELDEKTLSCCRIYLRRRFEEVLVSTRKAMSEDVNCWWGGTDAEIYRKWREHVAKGSAVADMVIDYNITRVAPREVLKSVGDFFEMYFTDEELDAAVAAGSRENMLREQRENVNNPFWELINQESLNENHPK